jgi:hypothetical protein
MRTTLKTPFLVTLALAGLLWLHCPASAHDDGEDDRFPEEVGEVHHGDRPDLSALHQDFHAPPYRKREHRRVHRWVQRRAPRCLGPLDCGPVAARGRARESGTAPRCLGALDCGPVASPR